MYREILEEEVSSWEERVRLLVSKLRRVEEDYSRMASELDEISKRRQELLTERESLSKDLERLIELDRKLGDALSGRLDLRERMSAESHELVQEIERLRSRLEELRRRWSELSKERRELSAQAGREPRGMDDPDLIPEEWRCALCRQPLRESVANLRNVVRCSNCGALYHVECIEANNWRCVRCNHVGSPVRP